VLKSTELSRKENEILRLRDSPVMERYFVAGAAWVNESFEGRGRRKLDARSCARTFIRTICAGSFVALVAL
jgi:hypothetical protein